MISSPSKKLLKTLISVTNEMSGKHFLFHFTKNLRFVCLWGTWKLEF